MTRLRPAIVLALLLAVLLPASAPARGQAPDQAPAEPVWEALDLPGGAVYAVESITRPAYADEVTRLRLVHALPGAGAVDLYVDGERFASGVDFRRASDYLLVRDGRRSLEIVPAGAREPILELRLQLPRYHSYSLVAHGGAEGPATSLLSDDAERGRADRVGLRVLNVSSRPALEAWLDGRTRLYAGLLSVGEPGAYLEVPLGEHRIGLREPGGAATGELGLRFPEGRGAYTAMAVDDASGTGLEVILLQDALRETEQLLLAAGLATFTGDRGALWQPRENAPQRVRRMETTPEGVIFARDAEGRIWRSSTQGRTWEEQNVLDGAASRLLAISPNYSRDSLALAITTEDWRLFRYERSRNDWVEVILKSGQRYQVGAAAYSPVFAHDEIVLVGTERGIYRSADSGQSWTLLAEPGDGAPVFGPEGGPPEFQGMLTSPDFGDDLDRRYDIDGRTVMAWNASGLYRSDDGGESWSKLPLAASRIRDLAMSNAWPADPVVAVALGDAGKLGAVSRDGGQSWDFVDAPAGASFGGTSVAMARDFGVPGFDIWYDEDTVSWLHLPFLMRTERPFQTRPFSPPEVDTGTREMLLATDGDGLWRSMDAGRSWPAELRDEANASLSSAAPSSLLFLPGSEGREVLAGTEASGLYRSLDGGLAWQQAVGLPRGTGQRVNALLASPDFARDGHLFAAAESGLWQSVDRGRSWQRLPAPAPARVLAISPAYGTDRTILADGRISRDGGQSWQDLPGSEDETWTAAAFSPRYASDRTLWMARALPEGSEDLAPLRVSTDAGASWSTVDASYLRRREVNALEVLSVGADPLKIFAATGRGLVVSEDGGEDWDAVSGVPSQAYRHVTSQVLSRPVTTAIIAATGERSTIWSTNRGVSWEVSPREVSDGLWVALSGDTDADPGRDARSLLIARQLGLTRFAGIAVGAE